MSVKLDITLQNRKPMTNGDLNQLKKKGIIPGVVYGKNMEATSVLIDRKELMRLLMSSLEEHVFFNVKLDDKIFSAIIQEKQWDVIKQEIQHVDFKVVDLNEEIKLYSEFRFNGVPKGVKQGGILETRFTKVKGKCLPMDYPKYLNCDISNIEIGGVLTMKDVELPSGLKVEMAPETVLLAVAKPKSERGNQTSSDAKK